jgi:hypothetical protein
MFDCNSWEAFLLKVPYFNITSYITFKKCLLLYFIFFLSFIIWYAKWYYDSSCMPHCGSCLLRHLAKDFCQLVIADRYIGNGVKGSHGY